MIAWGEVEHGGGSVSLETREGAWKCAPHLGYTYAPKMSFALNATDRFSQELEQDGWQGVSFDDSGWSNCVALDKQDWWGALAPRSIPFMTGAPVAVHAVRRVFALQNHARIVSMRVPAPNHAEIHAEGGPTWLGFQTWIHSPRAQTVQVGTFWAEYWLNGREVAKGVDSINKPMYRTAVWDLQEGWNHLGGAMKLYEDVAELYFRLPHEYGLTVSAVRDGTSPVLFRRTRLYRQSELARPYPYAADDPMSEVGGWLDVTAQDRGQSPCRERSWDDYADSTERLSPETLRGHVFRKALYPHGFSVLMDIDHMHLVFPRVRLTGVAGATLDLTYSEHLSPDKQHLGHSHNYQGGDRAFCSRDTIDFTPSHPKGMRYCMLTVRDAAGDVTLDTIALRAARYPVQYKGHFSCSDPLLNEIWEMGQRTQAANMEDAFVDCSGRERGMYLRDTILQYHSCMAAFGDHALMNRCFQLYGQSPDSTGKFRAVYPNIGDYTISDFALNALEGYYIYWANTGDLSRVRDDWQAIRGNLAWFHALADERKDLLLDAEWDKHKGVSAHYGGFHGDLGIVGGHMDNTGYHCVFSCTYLIAMRCARDLAVLLGEKADAAELSRRMAVLSRSLQKFWDKRRNCFADNLSRKTHSIHANLFAVRAGIATKPQLAAIRTHVAHELRCLFVNGYDPSAGVYASPNFGFYILEGLYAAGLVSTAQHMMRTGWGWALAQGMRTCPEYWNDHASLCHAWSAGPTWFLSRQVLGVHYPVPGDTSKVAIKVQAEGITSAEGAFPHPRGVVEVKWHLEKGRRVFDRVKAPRGVKVLSVT